MRASSQSVNANTLTEVTPWRFTHAGIAVRIFITCWLVYALHFATNTVREIYPALSLGDHLSFDVSEYSSLHPDIFDLPGRGSFINNNPGASILGAIPYALARPVIDPIIDRIRRARAISQAPAPEYKTIYPMAREFHRKAYKQGLDIKFGLAAGLMQSLLMAPLSALSAVLMFYVLVIRTGSIRSSIALSLLYAFATPIFYRTAQLNHNLLVAHFAFFAFVLLWRPWEDPPQPKPYVYLIAGLLSGWTVVLDYSGVIAMLCLSGYMLVQWLSLPDNTKNRRDPFLFAIGTAIALGVLVGYQWSSFGNPFYPPQHYMPPATFTGHGYRGMSWPQLDLLWKTAFDLRYGLFISSPLLLLALYVPGWVKISWRIAGRRETLFIAIFCLGYFLFCSANQYGRMQFNSGVRHIIPVVPFLFLIVAGVLLRMRLVVALLIGLLTVYWSWCLAMYRDVEQGYGVLESIIHITSEGLRLPWLQTLINMGYLKSQVWVFPLFLILGCILWLIWRPGVGKNERKGLLLATEK